MIFKNLFSSKKENILVFVRHCHFSSVSQHKKRPEGFSRQACYQNFILTLGERKDVEVTYLLDAFVPSGEPHFIHAQTRYPVIEIKEGTETGSFLYLLDHVSQLKVSPDTIIYFLEDDYLHREGWVDLLLEGFSLPGVDYITLYDHRDKYSEMYQSLESKLFHTQSCHWRTTPSTTNTYAMRHGTLVRDLEIHRQFSLGRKVSADHEKFCELRARGSVLISPMPGWSTHAEPEFASPCVDWEEMLKKSHVSYGQRT
jgi:hypothetical protein